MINCLISNCAGRHTTHVPAGGAAKSFILFNNKSKTNVAFHSLPACISHRSPTPHARAGQWHLVGRQRSQKEETGAGLPSWHFRIGVRVQVGVLEWKQEERDRDGSEMQHNLLQNCLGVFTS